MKKKYIIFKLLYDLAWIFVIYITIIVFLGKVTTRDIILIVIFYTAHKSIQILSYEIKKVVYSYKIYILLAQALIYLKDIHKTRYKLYFSGDKDLVEAYSIEIQRQGKAMITRGNNAILSNLLTKKYRSRIEGIIIQTKKLMETD